MKKYSDSIRKYIQKELAKSALNYLREGLDMFHSVRKYSLSSIQPSAGNLGIAIELMLKALLAKHNPFFIFKDLPPEIQILFTCPDSLPKDFNWRVFDIELRSFRYNMKELDECIALFYIFMPEHKQELSAHFKLLSRIRNASVHSVLPSFQKYDLERLAYLTLNLYSILESAGAMLSASSLCIKKEDKQFLIAFDKERIERVKKKIDDAKEKSKRITTGITSVIIDGWESYITECPICKSDGILMGYTDIEFDAPSEEGAPPEETLNFYADNFICEGCGLQLDDTKELELAGMDSYYDRSHELYTKSGTATVFRKINSR